MGLFNRRPVNFREALAAAREIGLDVLRPMELREAAALVAATALKTKAVDPADPTIDWEGLVAFIERMLPLILSIIELFG